MRYVLTALVAGICIAMAAVWFRRQGRVTGSASRPPAFAQAGSRGESRKSQAPRARYEVTTRYTGVEFLRWPPRQVDGKDCRVSPVLNFGSGWEVNHHRVAVDYAGSGSVQLSLAHSRTPNLDEAVGKKYLHSRFMPLKSGKEVAISSPYKGESCVWLIVRSVGEVKITSIRHTCWRGKGTLYGHLAGAMEFRGAKLPYRLMFPRNYDPSKSYPLVLSVSGSGGVGTRNVRSMEMVILARYLFTRYYYDEELACFSIVPQIPPGGVIPAPYWPKGELGRPTPVYHPDWPAVNENGWYTQATLALIRTLIEAKAFNIDPERVYYSGFSYGGKGCWEFLKAGREVFAAAMCGAGWAVGRAHSNPTGALLQRLELEVRRYKHIPVHIFAGELDPMRHSSRAVHRLILAQGGKSTYMEFPKTVHVASAEKGWGNREQVAWLFRQQRKNNPNPGKDPFGRGVYPESK